MRRRRRPGRSARRSCPARRRRPGRCRRCGSRASPACPRSRRCGSPSVSRGRKAWTIFGPPSASAHMRVQAVARPDRRQAAEHLVAGEAVAAVHPLGLAGRQQHRQVVAALGVPGGEDLARHRLLQQPVERAVAAAPEIGGRPDPVEVHVDAERGRRRVIGEAALLAADLGQVRPRPPSSCGTGIVR